MRSHFVKPMLAVLLVLGVGLAVAVPPVATQPLVLDWRVIGTGVAGGPLAANCQQIGPLTPGCFSNSSGSVLGQHIGSGTYTLHVQAGAAGAANSTGGVCFPADGSAAVTAANGDVINLATVGWLCEEGIPGTPYHYNGTYRINSPLASGTGRFADAVGGGNLAATFEKGIGGVTFIKIDGTINF